MNKQVEDIDILNAVAKSDHEQLFSNTDDLTVNLGSFSSIDEVTEVMRVSEELKALIRQPQADQATTRELATFIEQYDNKENSSLPFVTIGKKISILIEKLGGSAFTLKTVAATASLVLAISFTARIGLTEQWQIQYNQIAIAPDILELYKPGSAEEALTFNLPIMRGAQDISEMLRPILDEMVSEGSLSAEIGIRQNEENVIYSLERLARISDPTLDDQSGSQGTLISSDPDSECDLFRLSPSGAIESQAIERSSFFAYCNNGFLDTVTRIN